MKIWLFPSVLNKNHDHFHHAYYRTRGNTAIFVALINLIVEQLKCKFMDRYCGLDVHKDSVFGCTKKF